MAHLYKVWATTFLQYRHSQNYTIRTQSTSSQAKIKPTIAIKERVNLVTIEVTMTPVA
jgi:hypothetical protein